MTSLVDVLAGAERRRMEYAVPGTLQVREEASIPLFGGSTGFVGGILKARKTGRRSGLREVFPW